MKKILLALTLFLALIFVACSKKASPGKVKMTTYETDVLPLIQVKCTPCHLPSKGGFKANFETYASAMKFGADMVVRIQRNPTDRGFMPFKHDKLSEAEIAVFKKWVDGGMQEK